MKIVNYHVTGVATDNRRFKLVYPAGEGGRFMALNINIWRGSVWQAYEDGTRLRIKQVYN